MPTTRSPVSSEVEQQLLLQSKRRCCLCFGLHGDDEEKPGQLAHIDRDSSNSDEKNLAYLCLEHHNQYDSIPKQTRRLKSDELQFYKTRLYKHLGTLRTRWRLIINADFETLTSNELEQIRSDLERHAGGLEISLVSVHEGSVILKLESSTEALSRILDAFDEGTLSTRLGLEILGIDDASDVELHRLIGLSSDLFSEERLVDALECCQVTINKFPDNWQPWLLKSNILLRLHRIEEMGHGINYLNQAYFCCACPASVGNGIFLSMR